MTAETIDSLLPDSMLTGFRDRAPRYDAENVFFHDDLEDLRGSGYLAGPVPVELGGSGLSFEQLLIAQRRLASYAPATALGVNMHLVWVQVARFLHDRGIATLDWVLRDAAAGEIFAFGISEAGNDAVLLDAFAQATQVEGGFEVTGTKIFTTLSPVWSRLGVHAQFENSAGEQKLVFGFVRRDSGELVAGSAESVGQWNPLGMRATQSFATRLEGARVADADVAAQIDPFDGSDPLILAIFASFSLTTAAVYAGIADRALELATAAANRLMPVLGAEPAPRLEDPDTAAHLTRALLEHRASLDSLEVLARDVDEQRDRDDWFVALAAARNRVTDEARAAVETAMRLVSSAAFDADSELARLYRDVLAGLFHPSSSRSLASSVRRSVAQ